MSRESKDLSISLGLGGGLSLGKWERSWSWRRRSVAKNIHNIFAQGLIFNLLSLYNLHQNLSLIEKFRV